MNCSRPVPIEIASNGDVIIVPCGKCLCCIETTAKNWQRRLEHELTTAKGKGVMFDLTYDNEHLPSKGVNREHVKKFLKKMFRKIGRRPYFVTSEYGEIHGRPHYHGLLLNTMLCDLEPYCDGFKERSHIINSCWEHGKENQAVPLKNGGIRYVVSYLTKGTEIPPWYKNKPFRLMSKGIGKRYALENAEKIFRYGTLKSGLKDTGLPRYYLKILGINSANCMPYMAKKLINRVEYEQKMTELFGKDKAQEMWEQLEIAAAQRRKRK